MARMKKYLPWFFCICVSVVLCGVLLSGNLHQADNLSGGSTLGMITQRQQQQQQQHITVPKSGVSEASAAPTQPAPRTETIPAFLDNTAAITMAAGDEAARLAVVLMQSLRDVKTQIPHLVVMLSRGGLGSKDCQDPEYKRAHNREQISCSSPDTVAPEIISQVYLDALDKLGVETIVIDQIPDTPYTVIPGGRQIFWGMAFNKLRVFNMTQYRKVLWMDSDTLILKNIDHLLMEPMFTAALTYDCCNPNGPAKPSGGLWVVDPSVEVMDELMKLIAGPVPGTNEVWHWGDMQVVKYLFGAPPPLSEAEPYWPSISDARHGYVPGLKYLPEIAEMTDVQFQEYLNSRVTGEKRKHEGFMNSTWDGKHPEYVWKILDIRYDQCVGMCECLPGRDMPKTFMSVHFSCIHHIGKPAKYETEEEYVVCFMTKLPLSHCPRTTPICRFMSALYNYALSCTRYYYLLWYEKYVAAMGPLPQPHWTGPAIPLYNSTHDEFVRAKRQSDNV